MITTFTSSKKTILLAGLAACTLFTSCGDNDDNPDPKKDYTVPATYNFENVDYSGQTTRILMLAEMDSVIKTANKGATLDSVLLRNMYAGTNFARPSLNGTNKDLKSKTISTAQAEFDNMLGQVARTSASATQTASNGTAGVVTTNDGGTHYLVDENGVEWGQMISKGLMGAVFYNQAVDGYLTPAKIGNGVNNTEVEAGAGTKMEHHWDEAFGYFGAPKDFPANKQGLMYWAKYSDKTDAVTNSNSKLMNAFLQGRAAISNKDMEGKDEATAIIRSEWENVIAATVVSYLNSARKNNGDIAKKLHYLSEAKGFAMALGYKSDRKISVTQLTEVHNKLGANFYNTTNTDINAAIDIISNAYGFESIKNNL